MKFKIASTQDRLKVARTYGLRFNSKYKYCENSELFDNDLNMQRQIKDDGYKLKYFDGCFKPFLVKEI